MAHRTAVSPTAQTGAWPKRLLGAVALVVVVGVLGFTGVLAQARQFIPGLSQSGPSYQTAPVQRGTIGLSVIATGPIAAVNTTPLTFKTSGKLAELKVGVGDRVSSGQVLAVLDPSDLQTALDQARANLDQAQANLTKVQAGVTSAQKAVAQTSVDNATKSAANAQASISTTTTSASNTVTVAQESVHTAELNLGAAQDALKAAQDSEARGLAADQTGITNAQKNLETVKATVAADGPILQQQLERAKDSLWSTQIGRDATCSRSQGSDCASANANVAGAETSLTTAAAQADQTRTQDQQQIVQAQTQLDQANVQLASDKAKLAASVVSAQDQIKQTQASLANAQTGVAQANAQATATLQSAQAQTDQANGALKSAQASYALTVAPPDPADVAVAKAQVVNAQAAFDTAQANRDAATLTAPAAGTVAAVNGAVGQFVSGGPVATGDTALFTLVDLNDLQVTAQVNEADIAKVKLGDAVTYTVSAFPDTDFTGKVLSIQPIGTVVQNVVNYAVTCSIQSTKGAALYSGMTAAATIVSERHAGVLVVPNAALSLAQTMLRDGLVKPAGGRAAQSRTGAQPGGQSAGAQQSGQQRAARAGTAGGGASAAGQGNANRGIVLTLRDGQLTTVPVTLGITDGTNTEIVAGLQEGDAIVVGQGTGTSGGSGNATGRPGQGGNPLGGGFRG